MNGWPDETGMSLVDRLRRGAQSAVLSHEAADEIERLTKERDEARQLNALWTQHDHKPALMASNMRLLEALTKARAAIQVEYTSWLKSGCLLDDERCPIRETMDEAMEDDAKEYEALLADIDAALAVTGPAIQHRQGDGGADNRDISHWAGWSDGELLDQAASACQHPALLDDQVVRSAIAMNIIAPFRQALAKARS